jgi:S1-C subfamily serine protease
MFLLASIGYGARVMRTSYLATEDEAVPSQNWTDMRPRWFPGLMLLTVALLGGVAGAAQPPLRQAVVSIEIDTDLFSLGPTLSAELKVRQPLSPYEGELARRLRLGSTGTGFFVNADGDLVTNAHVLLSGVRYRTLPFTQNQWDSMTRLLSTMRDAWVTVGSGDGARIYAAKPVALDESLDLAVLRIARPLGDESAFIPLPIGASHSLRAGQAVTALGFPENGFQASAGAVISLIHGAHVHEEMRLVRPSTSAPGQPAVTVSGSSQGPVVRLQHSATTGHGSSGGPLLDARNHVIGVCYASLVDRSLPDSEETDLNLAIASDVLKQFLKEHAIPFTEAAP